MLLYCTIIVFLTALPAADSPLADAAERADWKSVDSQLAAKADVTVAQKDGTTALHWAAYHDRIDVAKKLLAAGTSAKVENSFGVTPLSLACTNGNEEIVKALLAAGADANTALRGGETVLMTAARTGKVGPVKALLDAGAKVDAKDRKDQTALMWAAADGHAGVVETLLKAGAEPKARLRSGFTPLLFAARDGRTDVVKVLLKAGVRPDEAIERKGAGGAFAAANGTAALSLAVENGHFELAMVLVKAGADPNDQRSGYTALHRLTWVRRPNRGDDPDGAPPPAGSGKLTALEFVREIVKAGARVNTKLDRGPSPKGKLAMPGATAFLMAAKTADLPYMKLLVELGADPHLTNRDGTTPLMAAAGLGCFAPDEEAGTEAECLAAVEYLLTFKPDVNAVDANGETAMHGAAYKSLPKMVDFLAAHGAKVDVWHKKNKSGWSPVMIAEGFRNGNFKPSVETLAALHGVLKANDVTPPPPTPRTAGLRGYDDGKGPPDK